MVRINQILTHESPDIDAILSVLLLQLYGENQFPGVSSAEVKFAPAGVLPDGSSPEELERQGIMAVDTGGGRFDTHPGAGPDDPGDTDRSASDLVAESVGVLESPQWADLVEFVRLHDSGGRGIQSTDPVHHFFTIPNILAGMAILFERDPQLSLNLFLHGSFLLRLTAAAFECRQSTPEFDYQPVVKDIALRAAAEWEKTQGESLSESATYLEWKKRLDNDPESTVPPEPLDRVVSMPTVVEGLYSTTKGDKDRMSEKMGLYLRAVLTREQRWMEAVAEVDADAVVHAVGKKVRVAQIASDNGLVIKALRMRTRADLTVYRNPTSGATSFLIRRNGPLRYFRMAELAANVRIAECVERGVNPEYDRIKNVGLVHGWFLHQSENLLIRGSLKATNFEASRIAVETLARIAVSQIDQLEKIPTAYCPDDRCTREACKFYRLRLRNCRSHRMRLGSKPATDSSKSIEHSTGGANLTDFGEKLRRALESKKNSE